MTFKSSFIPSRPNVKIRSLRFLFFASILVSTLLLSTIYVNSEADCTAACQDSGTLFDYLKGFVEKIRSAIFWDLLVRFQSRPRLILLWTTYFSKENWLPKLEDLGCPHLNCKVTSNRSLLNDSDAVVFHLRDVNKLDLPPWRSSHQRWVLFNKEAPPHTPVDTIIALERKIHWTITYRRDSDIYAPYGRMVKRSLPLHRRPNKSSLRPNSGIVCWVVSNCVTPSRREEYVEKLRHHIPVHTFGKCSGRPCSAEGVYECYAELSKSCMFYLSFENSLCTDYATEKLYSALRTDMIPIVMGAEDSYRSLPNHSYINALDFENPKDLASLLFNLTDDVDKYEKYLEWKTEYDVEDTSYNWACDLCIKLQEKDPTVRVHSNLASWWFGNASCYSWSEYFRPF